MRRTRTRTRATRAKLAIAGAAAVMLASATALFASSSPSPSSQDRAAATASDNTPYNGKFVFARLRHSERMGGFGRGFRGGYCSGPPWQHDYPCAERNLMSIISNATTLKPGAVAGNVIDIGDPELHKYPIAYLSHPDVMVLDEAEVANLRSYLLKGGFIIFDDFPAGQVRDAWGRFYQQMKVVLPELEPVQLDAKHPIFHSFFDFDSLAGLYGAEYGTNVAFAGYFENNDPTKRMLAIVNYNNDLGENWEYEDRGLSIIPEGAGEAFKFGVNYIMYALTH